MISVKQIPELEWRTHFAKDAHQIVFRETWDAGFERIDFALLTHDEKEQLVQFATIREMDSESAYIQYGGAFPDFRNSKKSLDSFSAILNWLEERYKNVGFLTENTNFPMLKFAIKKKFIITGVRFFKGHLLLEHFKSGKAV